LRPLNLVDLASLAYLQVTVTPNEAVTRDSFDVARRKALPVGLLMSEWFPVRRSRHAWVFARGSRVYGLVTVRRRLGPSVWDIEKLQVQQGKEDLIREMLERLSMVAGRMGIEKLFLRLGGDSPFRSLAADAGFGCYVRESLYELQSNDSRPRTLVSPEGLRPVAPKDQLALFSLYHAVAPPSVMCAEGITFQEWHESWEGPAAKGKSAEFVVDAKGKVAAWMKLTEQPNHGLVDMLISPGESTLGDQLVDFGLGMLVTRDTVYCFLPEFLYFLKTPLERKGFSPVNDYALMYKQVVQKARETGLMPASA